MERSWTSAKRKRNELELPSRQQANLFRDADCCVPGGPDDEALMNLFAFLELTKSANVTYCDLDGKLVSATLKSTVERIITLYNTPLSGLPWTDRQDISNMVIAWATKNLLFLSNCDNPRNDDLDILWRSLAISIEVHLGVEKSSSLNIHPAFPTQVLNKLVPFALKTAFVSEDTIAREHASKSFTLLSDTFYRPTFDLCCNTLLVEFVSHVRLVAVMSKDEYLLPDKSMNSMVLTFIRLLQTLQTLGVSTPKKIFQVLAKESVFLSISKLLLVQAMDEHTDVQQLVSDVLREAFFSPGHHMEGYLALQVDLSTDTWTSREKWKESIFRCYQGDLLYSVSCVMRKAVNEDDKVALSKMIVTMVEGFLFQANIWKRDFHNQYTSKNKSSVTAMIFRVWGVLTNTLLMAQEDSGYAALMAPFVSCLKALLDHSGYHPTFIDKDKHHFSFLQSISRRLHLLISPLTSRCGLEGLVYLLRLNYLVFHHDLPGTIAIACNNVQTQERNSFHLLICSLFKTYQQLRQLDYLVKALLVSTEMLRHGRQGSKLSSAFVVLRDSLKVSDVARVIANSVVAAPYGQVLSLFDVLNARISSIVLSMQEDDSRSLENIAIVTTLFVFFIRNLKIDEHNSKEILSLCEVWQGGPGSLMLEHSKKCVALGKHGISLCGWILDLRNRCSFWCPGGDEFKTPQMPESLVDLLNALSAKSFETMRESDDTGSPSWLMAPFDLQFLACHRIQQLHSLIHDSSIHDFNVESTLSAPPLDLKVECQRLVGFVISNALFLDKQSTIKVPSMDREDTVDTPWILLARFLPAWTPYCEHVHIRLFLGWIFRELPCHQVSLPNTQRSNRSWNRRSPQNDEENLVVKAVLLDSSFYENRRIVSDFLLSGLLRAATLISSHLDDHPILSFFDEENCHTCMDERQDSIWSAFVDGSTLSPRHACFACPVPNVEAAIQILEVLNRSPSGCRKIDHFGKVLLGLLGLDVCIRTQITSSGNNHNFVVAGIKLIAGIRLLFTRALLENDRSDVRSLICFGGWLVSLVNAILTSTIEMSRCLARMNPSYAWPELCESSGGMLESLFLTCIDTEAGKSISETLHHSEFPKWPQERGIFLSLICRLAKGLAAEASVAGPLVHEILNQIRSGCFSEKRQEATLLINDFSNAISIGDEGIKAEALDLIQGQVLSLDITRNSEDFNLLACVLLNRDPNCEVADTLYRNISKQKSFGFIDDVVLCRLALQISRSLFSDFLELCLNYKALGCSSKSSRILKLLLETADQANHREVMAQVGTKILAHAIDSLVGDQQANWSIAAGGASLLTEMTKHKDIVCLKERDIARIFSQISCLPMSGGSSSMEDTDNELFYQFCSLVTSLAYRFPKQVHTCVASLTHAVTKLFHFVLICEQNESQLIDHCRAFSRLCDMLIPHKEILKKHITGLIQDFIKTLNNGMTPTRKKLLTPSMYSLLETLSEYEVSHLSVVLDTTSKALFQSFYDGYQKWHVYKGRY